MLRTQWVLCLAAAGALSATGQAPGNQFLGTWENVDAANRVLARLTVTATPNGLQARGFGKCQPADCDWAPTQLNILGASSDDPNPSLAMATWDLGFAETHLVAHLEGREMMAEIYTIFKDNRGRVNYRSSEHLRQPAARTERPMTPTIIPPPSNGIGTGIGTTTGPGTSAAGVYRIGGGVSAPIPTYREEPKYSESARQAKISGSVLLSLVVGEDGIPRDIRVVRSLESGLDQNAIETVAKWRFRPGQKDGKPVPVQANIEVNFRLLDKPQ